MTVHSNFCVFRRSENTNSFGLRQYWVFNSSGEVYTLCGNHLRDHKIGDKISGKIDHNIVDVQKDGKTVKDYERVSRTARFDGYELVERKEDVPADLIKDFMKEYWDEIKQGN